MTEWQPIATAPQDGTEILIWTGVCMYVAKYAYADHETPYWQPEGLPAMRATHWMVLPEPPK